jgi:tRNA-splicing ligase RtcB
LSRTGINVPLEKIGENTWRISMSYKEGMRVPGRIYADEGLLEKMRADRTLEQCANVAHLPGIYKYAITLPDGHEGYGFPIGGVAATDLDEGVVSPGGVGYDINCGVRLLTTNLREEDARPRLEEIADALFRNVPSGLGSSRKKFRLSRSELDDLVREGVPWLIERGMGWPEDAEHCEEEGQMKEADPDKLSDRAKQRGLAQVGTLGSGNHFLEVQRVGEIYDEKAAEPLGITGVGQVTVMIHTGSRGFGHQVCSDYLRVMERAMTKYGITLQTGSWHAPRGAAGRPRTTSRRCHAP